MATTLYEKIGFKDRQDSKPDSYLVNGVATSITKDNSGLVQAGTNLNQENLDHMEEGILQNSRDIRTLDTTVGEHTSQLADITTDVGEKTTLKTTDKTSLVNAVNELFTNANNGKTLISNVVGSPLLATDTFQQQHDKIQTLLNTFATNLTAKEQPSVGTEGLKSLVDKVAKINVGKKWASGVATATNKKLTVGGLNFTPAIIVATPEKPEGYINIDTTFLYLSRYNGIYIYCNGSSGTGNMTVTYGYFSIPILHNVTYVWYAYE